MTPLFEELLTRALPYLTTRDNEIHTRVALAFAHRLLAREGGDEGIVIPAVILHDVGWSRVPEELLLSAFGPNATRPELRDLHEREGAAIARKILDGLHYPKEKSAVIAAIIARHDSTDTAETLEEGLVKDADRLWRYSAEAQRVDPARFNFTVEENLAWMGERLDGWLLTPSGREIALAELRARWAELRAAGDTPPQPSAAPCGHR